MDAVGVHHPEQARAAHERAILSLEAGGFTETEKYRLIKEVVRGKEAKYIQVMQGWAKIDANKQEYALKQMKKYYNKDQSSGQ
jgi:hypothetical protein